LAWLFIHIGFLTGYRNRVGAVLSWWFAFTRDVRRERTFTVDDLPATVRKYGEGPQPEHAGHTAEQDPSDVDTGGRPR